MNQDTLQIVPIKNQDQAWVKEITNQRWGADYVVVHGEIFHPWKMKGYIALDGLGVKLGLATYRLIDRECEIITLDSFNEGQGVGQKLLARVVQAADKAGCGRVCLTTTNDNQRGIAFYSRNGFRLAAVHQGAVERAREIKPSIPLFSPDGIPIKDELEFELILNQDKAGGERK